jgi:hypothetical protein
LRTSFAFIEPAFSSADQRPLFLDQLSAAGFAAFAAYGTVLKDNQPPFADVFPPLRTARTCRESSFM